LPTTSSYYYWNFGDGVQQQTSNPLISHYYTNSGWYAVSLTVYNYSNPLDTCTASVTDSVFISEGFAMLESASISLHPNPAVETLNYNVNAKETAVAESVEVMNGIGLVVKKEEYVILETIGNSVDITNLPPGLYTIKINVSGHTYSKQFLKN
jgi:PKD repeat protein